MKTLVYALDRLAFALMISAVLLAAVSVLMLVVAFVGEYFFGLGSIDSGVIGGGAFFVMLAAGVTGIWGALLAGMLADGGAL
jgi:hypothetical protein